MKTAHIKKARELKEFSDLTQSLRDFHPLVLDSQHMSLDCFAHILRLNEIKAFS
jgi:hypothetical protein